MVDETLADLNGRAVFSTEEVQRHAHGHRFISIDTLEVNVHDLRLVRMHLESAQNNELILTIQFHRQNRGVELFLAQGVENRIVFELDRRGRNVAAVNNTGQLVGAAQTAARTRTLRLTRGGDDFHKISPKLKFPGRDHPLGTKKIVKKQSSVQLYRFCTKRRVVFPTRLKFTLAIFEQSAHRVFTSNARDRFTENISYRDLSDLRTLKGILT